MGVNTRKVAQVLIAAGAGKCNSSNTGGHDGFLCYFVVPYCNYCMMGPENPVLIIKAPIIIRFPSWGLPP